MQFAVVEAPRCCATTHIHCSDASGAPRLSGAVPTCFQAPAVQIHPYSETFGSLTRILPVMAPDRTGLALHEERCCHRSTRANESRISPRPSLDPRGFVSDGTFAAAR